jgi:two-component system chemotaxis sensor kinase CheA
VGDKPSSQAIHEFLAEAEEILEKLNLDLVIMGEQIETGDVDPDIINGVFRGAHSLKGLSGMFGFADISDLSHQMENILDSLRLGKLSMTQQLLEAMFQGLETLSVLVSGKADDEDFTVDLTATLNKFQAVLTGVPVLSADPFANLNIDQSLLNVLTEYEEHRLQDNLTKGRNLFLVKASFNLASFDHELEELTDILKKSGEVISTLPSPGDVSDQIGFQLLVGTDRELEVLRRAIDREAIEVTAVSGKTPPALPLEFESLEDTPVAVVTAPLEEPGLASNAASDDAGGTLRSFSRTVRVDIEKLDNLMNIVGELVLSKGAISRISDEIKTKVSAGLATDLHKAVRGLERRLDELQAGVMEVRMVPISQLFDKMTRIVRRVANEHDKRVSLDIRGADTELDKLIVEDLTDPLMHIIRNAIDHGIESPAERAAAGKKERATICLWASQKGNHVVIEIKDDGHGIDTEKVRLKAVEKGLVSADAELSRDDIYELLFMPGFSTRDEVSDLSGRGVGMDVVKNNISSLSGMIEIDSEAGKGTTMTITLPITLAIIKALIVKVSGKIYAIPINSVLETLMIDPESIETIERREVIELRNSTLPLLRLSEIFQLSAPEKTADKLFVTVVGLADKRMGIVVDELLGQQDVVIKSLGAALSFVKGIAGAADLGSQRTILVLDVGGLMGETLRGEAGTYV